MPYNPSQTYTGGSLLASGIANLGEGLGKGISAAFTGVQKAKEEQSANQLIIDYALKTGMITPDKHEEYLQGSASTKNGVVAGLTRTLAMDMQRKQEERLTQSAALQQQKAPYELRSAIASSNYDVARAQKERSEIAAPGTAGDPQLKKLMNPYTGKPTDWAMAVDPVSKQRQVVYVGEGGVEIDPATGTPVWRGKGGTRPLTKDEVIGMTMGGGKLPGAHPTPASKEGQGTLDWILGKILGSKPAASPTPAPAPGPNAPAPAPSNNAGGGVDAIAVLREAKAAIAKNPGARTAIIERVSGMGIDASGL